MYYPRLGGSNNSSQEERNAYRYYVSRYLGVLSAASAQDYGHPTAFVVSPIHEAQIVRGDDGMDHVEYDLLVVSVLPEPVTLSSVTVLDPAGKELMRIERAALAAATQPLFAHTKTTEIPASAAVAVEVDLILPPDTAPERLTHRIAYSPQGGLEACSMSTAWRLTHRSRHRPPTGHGDQAAP